MIFRKDDAKVVVEFFGPSGVGKSTFEKFLLETTHPDLSLSAWQEACNSRIRVPRTISSDIRATHGLLLEKKLDNVKQRDFDEHRKEKLSAFFERVINQDLRVLKSSARGLFLRGDGIFHNFGSELLELPEENVQALAKGRLFVRLRGPTKVICERAQKREREGQNRPQYQGKSSDEIIHAIEQATGRSLRLDELLSRMGHHVLAIDVTEPLATSANRVHRFLLDSLESSERTQLFARQNAIS